MTIARFTQWCQFSHGHEMQPDQYGSWVRALDYESLAASCARAAKDAVQFQDERDEARRRLAEAERLMRSAVEFWEWEVSGGLRFEFQDFLRASDNGEAVQHPGCVPWTDPHGRTVWLPRTLPATADSGSAPKKRRRRTDLCFPDCEQDCICDRYPDTQRAADSAGACEHERIGDIGGPWSYCVKCGASL